MLADTQLRSIKPQGKAYKIADDLGRYCSVMYLIELMLILPLQGTIRAEWRGKCELPLRLC